MLHISSEVTNYFPQSYDPSVYITMETRKLKFSDYTDVYWPRGPNISDVNIVCKVSMTVSSHVIHDD